MRVVFLVYLSVDPMPAEWYALANVSCPWISPNRSLFSRAAMAIDRRRKRFYLFNDVWAVRKWSVNFRFRYQHILFKFDGTHGLTRKSAEYARPIPSRHFLACKRAQILYFIICDYSTSTKNGHKFAKTSAMQSYRRRKRKIRFVAFATL